jgi:hypothetical protein
MRSYGSARARKGAVTVPRTPSFPLAKPFAGRGEGSDGLPDGAPSWCGARPPRPPWDSYARRGKAQKRIAVPKDSPGLGCCASCGPAILGLWQLQPGVLGWRVLELKWPSLSRTYERARMAWCRRRIQVLRLSAFQGLRVSLPMKGQLSPYGNSCTALTIWMSSVGSNG